MTGVSWESGAAERLGCTPVYGGVRVAHLRNCWYVTSALDVHPFMVGSVLLISGAAGTLRVPWMHTRLWWSPCCSSQELLARYERLGCTPVYGGVRVAHLRSCWHVTSALDAHPFMMGSVLLFSSLCCVFILFFFVLCLVCTMMSVSFGLSILDCPFTFL